jgi:ubiquinone/menaquinone biosynthesis C-methylase UbiE
MPDPGYLHGFTDTEQRRLIEQAAYWRDPLILPDLPYRAGERLLDIGCGVGAVLRTIAEAHPGLRLAGIDAAATQIDVARRVLRGVGAGEADLVVGDAAALPWPVRTFDHVYMMWFVEHLPAAIGQRVLHEALRVLRPGGSITHNETDYDTPKIWPPSPDFDALMRAQRMHFARSGNPDAGTRLAGMLAAAGFGRISTRVMGFHVSNAQDASALRRHADYIVGFLGPAVPSLAGLGFDESALRRGVEHLRDTVPAHAEGMITHGLYRVRAYRPG